MTNLFAIAKQYHQSGELLEAEANYRLALDEEPDVFKVYNNLGAVLEEQGRLDEAIESFHKGITLEPNCFLLHYNLGRALQQVERMNEALISYLRALELEPDSFETHYNLGNLLCDQGRFASAIDIYQRALQYNPECKQAHSNLGTAYFEGKRFAEAAACYERAVAIDPESASEHFHLGKTLEALGRCDDAIQAYRRSLEVNPLSSVGHVHLVMLLQNLEQTHEVEQVFREWRERMPDDPVAHHMWASHSGQEIPSRASDSYVRSVFDQFASDFDGVLSRLNYRAPQLLLAELANRYPRPAQDLRILDAGCGTGICGPLLKPYAGHLVGVDLSVGMLQKARLRGVYDELLEAELTAYLDAHPAAFDVIVSADTLVYFGDLEPVIRGAKEALHAGGLLLFTTEALEMADTSGNYRLNQHGRYSHAIEYVGLLLQRSGLEILTLTESTLRTEAAKAVRGLVVMAMKSERC